jgi:hypothetical protein
MNSRSLLRKASGSSRKYCLEIMKKITLGVGCDRLREECRRSLRGEAMDGPIVCGAFGKAAAKRCGRLTASLLEQCSILHMSSSWIPPPSAVKQRHGWRRCLCGEQWEHHHLEGTEPGELSLLPFEMVNELVEKG